MNDTNTTLWNLATICRASQRGYQRAAQLLTNTEYNGFLTDLSRERQRFANTIEHCLRQAKRDSAELPPLTKLHYRWMTLRSKLSRNRSVAILAECARGDEIALETYQHALRIDLPSNLRAIICKQASLIERNLLRVQALNNTVLSA